MNFKQAYLFSSSNTDKLTLGSPFTGNIKVILAAAATAITGIHPDISAGIQGAFVPSTDPVGAPNWNQFEADVTAIDYLVDETFDGVVGVYGKDDVFFSVDMGVEGSGGFDVDKIVMLGASITNQCTDEFTVPMLEPYILQKYGKIITIENRAVSGEDVADLRAHIDTTIAEFVGEPNTVFYIHVGGNDISPGVEFLNTPGAGQAQKIADLEYIYDAVHGQGQKLLQAGVTFRNYSGNTIDADPSTKVNELGGSFTYTRDWIAGVMANKAPEFLIGGLPIIDQYNVTRNVYKDWRENAVSPDHIHPSRYARIIYEMYAIESVVKLSLGQSVVAVTPRNFNNSVNPATATHFTLGFGRNTEIGNTDDNINWTIRTRPTKAGAEPIYIDNIINTVGASTGLKMYSYTNLTVRQGGGNTADPTNNTATVLNDVLLSSGLGIDGGNGVFYVVIEGVEPMKSYTVKFAASSGASSGMTAGYLGLTDDSTAKLIDSRFPLFNGEDTIQTSTVISDFEGKIMLGVHELNTNNWATISGIEISST